MIPSLPALPTLPPYMYSYLLLLEPEKRFTSIVKCDCLWECLPKAWVSFKKLVCRISTTVEYVYLFLIVSVCRLYLSVEFAYLSLLVMYVCWVCLFAEYVCLSVEYVCLSTVSVECVCLSSASVGSVRMSIKYVCRKCLSVTHISVCLVFLSFQRVFLLDMPVC